MAERANTTKTIRVVKNRLNARLYREQRRREREKKAAIGVSLLFVAAALLHAFWNRSFNSYIELTSTPNSETNYTQFAVYQDGYLKYSKDGISYLDSSESIIWTEAYNMEQPSISVKGEYAAVADLEGNEILLYDLSGKVGSYRMFCPVKSVEVASQGVFCAVLESEDTNYIRLYDKEGGQLTDIKTQISDNGYPLDVAISSDGQKLVASFYSVDGINAKNVISFYHFGEGGKGQSGNLVGTYQMDDTLVPKVEFMDDETVCAIGDNQTILYRMGEKPKKICRIPFETEIKSVFSNEKYIGYLYENDAEDVEKGKAKPYQMALYNRNGRQVRSFGRDRLYETVALQGDTIICYTGSECSLVRTNGTEFFCQNMGQNIMNVLPGAKWREFLIVYSDRSARIRLKNTIGEEGEEFKTRSRSVYQVGAISHLIYGLFSSPPREYAAFFYDGKTS